MTVRTLESVLAHASSTIQDSDDRQSILRNMDFAKQLPLSLLLLCNSCGKMTQQTTHIATRAMSTAELEKGWSGSHSRLGLRFP